MLYKKEYCSLVILNSVINTASIWSCGNPHSWTASFQTLNAVVHTEDLRFSLNQYCCESSDWTIPIMFTCARIMLSNFVKVSRSGKFFFFLVAHIWSWTKWKEIFKKNFQFLNFFDLGYCVKLHECTFRLPIGYVTSPQHTRLTQLWSLWTLQQIILDDIDCIIWYDCIIFWTHWRKKTLQKKIKFTYLSFCSV